MSKYTTEIRFICESAIPLDKQGDGTDVESAIESGRNVLFNFPYELFLETYKEVIESKFLRHNYTREIGFETVGLFKLKLRDLWLMKLPYYNQLWKSSLLEFDPFLDSDYYVQHTGKGNVKRDDTTSTINDSTLKQMDNSTSNSSGQQSVDNKQSNVSNENANRNEDLLQKYSDTPQGALNGVIDSDWLTNATQNNNHVLSNVNKNDTQTGNSRLLNIDNNYAQALKDVVTGNKGNIIVNGNTNSSDEYLRHVWGKYNSRTYSKALTEFRETFLNVDEMFIKEFRNLFMLIY